MGRYREHRKVVTFNKRGLILCEGETEENYFNGLISQPKYKRKFQSISVRVFKPKDHSPFGMVKEAKRMISIAKSEKNPYDFVWVMFDKDGHAKIPDAFELARTSTPEIKIAFTIPCFEYFVLLHFDKTTKPFTKCDDVIHQIKKNWLPDYEKATNIFDILLPKKNDGLAHSEWVVNQFNDEIQSGKRIYELSVYSNVHDLVNYLYTFIKEKEN
jgi:hypothetical protein